MNHTGMLRKTVFGLAMAGLLATGPAADGGIIVNQLDTDRTGDWNFRADEPGNFANTYNGDGTHFAFGGASAMATSTANLSAGIYSVEMWMPSRSATDNALLTVQQGGDSTQFRLNQDDEAARWSGDWLSLGVYGFGDGDVDVVLDNEGASAGSDNVASMTGAVRFAEFEDGMATCIADSVFGPVGSEGEFYEETSGSWITSSTVPQGTDGIHWGEHRLSNDVDAEAVFSGMPLVRGLYELDITWGAGGNRTTSALLTIVDADEVAHEFTIDQTQDPSDIEIDGLMWDQFGTFDMDFANGISEIRLSSDDGAFLSADAVRLTYIPEPASLALLGAGGLVLLSRRNRQRG